MLGEAFEDWEVIEQAGPKEIHKRSKSSTEKCTTVDEVCLAFEVFAVWCTRLKILRQRIRNSNWKILNYQKLWNFRGLRSAHERVKSFKFRYS